MEIGSVQEVHEREGADQGDVPDREEEGDPQDRRRLDEHVERLVGHGEHPRMGGVANHLRAGENGNQHPR